MKVLITGHTPLENQDWWYKKYLGESIEVDEGFSDYHGLISLCVVEGEQKEGINILLQDCHIIEPTWKVMKDAEETGRDVEYWGDSHKKWIGKQFEGFFKGVIYRIKPEPKAPVYVPLKGEELAELVGKVIRKKSFSLTALIIGYSSEYKKVFIAGQGWTFADFLLEKYEHLDGSPIGKLQVP